MEKAGVLIRTKLHLPFTRPGLVPRPRLQEQIAQGLRGPLTLITAPAGFGKTTLVASCVAGGGLPRDPMVRVAWLSLDKNDNQAGRFLRYLVAALRETDPAIGDEAAQLLAAAQPAPSESVLTCLINDLDAAGARRILVLDDYQFISSQAVHEEVTFLLEHCPSAFHLVIATRSDPALPLARLRARGQMLELRAADLRFTEAEAAQFLNDVMGLHLDARSVAVLENRTEGWVAGLQMAALSMRDRKDVLGFIEGFSGTNRYILDYLLEEILANQPPEIQRFLLRTSILERLTAPLCDALLNLDEKAEPGNADGKVLSEASASPPLAQSASILRYLERENLFLVLLDDGSASGAGVTWFRYHHLFADLLITRLHQMHPELAPVLHIRAAAWLEQNGSIPEAIQHLIAANEIDRAADLIERYGPVHWAESDLSVVQMADSLPTEMLVERPKIGIYQVWLQINQGAIEKAYPLLKDLERKLAGANPDSRQHWIQTVVRLALTFLSPSLRAPGSDPLPDYRFLDEIPADEKIMREAAEILYGMTLGRLGEIDRAAEFSIMRMQQDKTLQKAGPSQGATVPMLVPFLATIYLFQGRLQASAALCREFLELFKEKGIRISTAGNLDVLLGNVLYELNRLEEAETLLRDGLQANEPWRNIMTDAFGLLALAYVLIARGDNAGAMQVVDQFETRLQGQSRPTEFAESFRTLRIRVMLASGEFQAAADWADQIRLGEDFQRHPEYYTLTLARIRLAQERYAEVERMLAGDPHLPFAGNRITRQLEINLLLAAAFAGQGRLPEAFELIEACLALAEPEGYIQIFLYIGEPARELLTAYLRSATPAHKLFAQKVLGAYPPSGGAGSPGPQPAGLVEPLSGREMEVLNLMALGKTNPEIARQLIVSPGTIKAHAASIYRKLDVANRTEAVARARQLGILT